MSVSKCVLGTLLLSGLLQLSRQTESLVGSEDICRLFPDGTILRKPGTCNAWITCDNYTSVAGETCEDSKLFKLSTAECTTKLDTTDKYCSKTICTTKTTGYVGDTLNCANWYYCDGKTLKGQGSCDNGMYFDTTHKQCVYPQHTTCEAEFELCEIVPTGVKIADEGNCSQYLTCDKGAIKTNACDSTDYYDTATGGCLKKSMVPCAKHPLPLNVCGTTKLAYRDKFVADGATCRGYFYCHDLGSGKPDPDPLWQQCTNAYFFDVDRQSCVRREILKCPNDRCDGIESGRTIAEVRGCKHYLECTDGIGSDPIACEDDKYFNVATEECTTVQQSYAACS